MRCSSTTTSSSHSTVASCISSASSHLLNSTGSSISATSASTMSPSVVSDRSSLEPSVCFAGVVFPPSVFVVSSSVKPACSSVAHDVNANAPTSARPKVLRRIAVFRVVMVSPKVVVMLRSLLGQLLKRLVNFRRVCGGEGVDAVVHNPGRKIGAAPRQGQHAEQCESYSRAFQGGVGGHEFPLTDYVQK